MSSPAKKMTGAAPVDVIGEISRVVSEITGVQLGERQRIMVETRLRKRIIELGLGDEQGYFRHFQANQASETKALVSLLTTHHTYFFREFSHFEHLERTGLQRAIEGARARGEKKIRVWSAAASRGQEAYSISMFLAYHLPKIAPDFSYEILGTDIDHESIAIANNGVYAHREIKEVPMHFITGHWAKGTGEIADYVKAKKSIKDPCKFIVANLMDFSGPLGNQMFDIIFCRNVFIYFTPKQIQDITGNMLKHLHPTGLLFIGISESLMGLDLPVAIEGPSVYVHKGMKAAPKLSAVAGAGAAAKTGAPGAKPGAPSLSVVKTPEPFKVPAVLRVLCVDDSPSIHTLLKQILKKEHGFEVVGNAINGLDAAKKVQELKPDVMTLDIHMPEQTGLEYLQKNFGSNHPPVVMISSVARENADLAIKCLESGASDYVEKPALGTMAERGDEIRTKLHYAYRAKMEGMKRDLSLDKSYSIHPTIKKPETKLRLLVGTLADRDKFKNFFRETTGAQPPTIILVEGSESALPAFTQGSQNMLGVRAEMLEGEIKDLAPGKIYMADFAKTFDTLRNGFSKRKTSILLFGDVTNTTINKVEKWPSSQILSEDMGKALKPGQAADVEHDVVPATSFAYMSIDFLSKD